MLKNPLPVAAVDALPSPVLVVQDYRLQYVNSAAREHFQFNGKPIDHYSLWNLVAVDDHERLHSHITLAKPTPNPINVVMHPLKGEPYPAILTFATIDEQTLLVTVTEVNNDHAQSPAEKPFKLDDLRTFMMTTISHEFRTPLSIILSSTELMDRYNDRITPEKRVEQLQKIKRQVLHLTDILNDIALIGAVEYDHIGQNGDLIDMLQLCHDVVARLSAGIGTDHHICLETGMNACKVQGDQTKLTRVIIDLLDNAVKFSAPGSTVRVCVEQQDGTVVIRVEDEGIGIPEDVLPMIFKPFYRAPDVIDTNGTGLGMAIVRIYTEMHGGTIDVASAINEGTTVTVTLPCHQG